MIIWEMYKGNCCLCVVTIIHGTTSYSCTMYSSSQMKPGKKVGLFDVERPIALGANHQGDLAPRHKWNSQKCCLHWDWRKISKLNLSHECTTGPSDRIRENMNQNVCRLSGVSTYWYHQQLHQELTIYTFHQPGSWRAIPKGNQIKSEKDLRPISIVPVLSKVHERLIFRQLSDFIDKNDVVNDSNIFAYRKGQSTTTVRQAIPDEIVKAMKCSGVTMMIFADFSKAWHDLFQKSCHQDE